MMMVGPYYYECLDREMVDEILAALSRDEMPPMAPAGYLEKDRVRPQSNGAPPTASQGLRAHLAADGGGTGKGKGE
jgi:hypothetical protein